MNPIKFAFLVHPRNMDDIKANYSYLKWIPNILLEFLLLFLKPRKIATITGLKNSGGVSTEGYLVVVFITARGMLLLPRFFVKRRIIQAVKLSKSIGAELVGLGMFTSPIMNGGLDLEGKYGIGITNGNALTASVSLDGVERIVNEKSMNINELTIAIIGATGSVGTAVSIGLVSKNPKKLILLGRTLSNLDSLKNETESKNNKNTEILISTNINNVKEADIIITATASPKALLKSEHLKQDAIVYDVAQPQNVSEDVKNNRKDVLIIDGGLVEGPEGISYDFNIGLPKNIYFACLTETMVLAIEGVKDSFSVGKATFENVLKIKEMASKHGFRSIELKNTKDQNQVS